MLDFLKNLDPVVQAAIITAVGGIIAACIQKKIKKKGNNSTKSIHQNQSDNSGTAVQIGEQNQNGNSNVQNNYYGCNIQSTQGNQEQDNIDSKFDTYLKEHTLSNEDIDKLLADDSPKSSDITSDDRITRIDADMMVKIKNLAGGTTVIIGDEKSITKQIVEEHDKEIEKALSEL